MSQDPNGNRIDSLTGPEAKTPAERARQIQQMQEAQRAVELAPVETHAPDAAPTPAKTASGAQHAAMFDVKPVPQVDLLKAPPDDKTDMKAYGANQAPEAALFGVKGADIEVTGVPWKIIPFGPSSVMDVKKPDAEYHFTMPEKAVSIKQGTLFELTATPKTGTDEKPIKRAVLVSQDKEPKLKGADWRTPAQLKKGIESIPEFALSLFTSMFGNDPVKPSELGKSIELVAVKSGGNKGAFEVTAKRKNQYNGAWLEVTTPLNNFGMKFPASRDPKSHDINVAMYYLDRFQAS